MTDTRHADDAIAFADARLFGRRMRIHLADDDRAFLIFDQHAHAAVEATGGGVERFQLLGRVELGVWVAQLLDQAAGGALVELARADGIHVAVADEREHLVEQRGTGGGGAFLHDEGTGRERQGEDGGQHDDPATRHAKSLWGKTFGTYTANTHWATEGSVRKP